MVAPSDAALLDEGEVRAPRAPTTRAASPRCGGFDVRAGNAGREAQALLLGHRGVQGGAVRGSGWQEHLRVQPGPCARDPMPCLPAPPPRALAEPPRDGSQEWVKWLNAEYKKKGRKKKTAAAIIEILKSRQPIIRILESEWTGPCLLTPPWLCVCFGFDYASIYKLDYACRQKKTR